MKKTLLLITLFSFGFWFNTSAQKGSLSPKNGGTAFNNSANCPLVVAIQDNTPSASCSELLKTLVAVSSACTDTAAVTYQWSSSIGGVFSTLRTTTFNLPEFLVATPVTFTVVATEGSETVSASYTITVKPRPSRPTLTPFGTIILCDNIPINLTSSACTGGSTTVWSNGVTGVTSISVPAVGGTYFKVACERNGCVSDSTAAAALVTGIVTQAPTTTSRTICEGTTITAGNGLQAQLVNCGSGQASTHTYTGGTVGYDQGYRSTGSVDPSVVVPTTTNLIRKVSISVTWRKQKGGFQNSCGIGDTESWPYHSETQFRVQSPSGKIVTLVYTGSYGGEANPTVTTVFEDGASPINYYSPPVSGTFAPAQPLSSFIGENPSGTWTLLPYDAVWKDPLCVSGFSVTFSDIQDGSITWWDAPTGGNQVGTGNEFIPAVTAAGTYTYYAQGKCSRGCPSTRVATTLTINATPAAPVIDVDVPLVNSTRSICNGESITLTATGCNNGGTVKWNGNIQGNNFATGNSYTFVPSGNASFNTSHTFTAICEGTNLCRSVNSNTITLIVKYKPTTPTITGPGSTACINSTVTLSVSGCSGGTVGWTGNRTGSSINFVINSNINIKAACTINGCTSDSSNVYSISTLPRPNTPSVNASQIQAICIGGSVTLSSNCASGTTTRWTGGLTGSPITITPTVTRSYRAACLGTNGCASDSSTALTITVLPKTKPTITGSSFVCGPTSTTLTTVGCSGLNETVMWRDQSIGDTFVETITQTKTFRAVCIRNGYCVSDSSDIFTVQYRNKPSQPTITTPVNTTVCQGNNILLTASACSGGTLGWTGGLSGTTITISAVGTRAYKVACTINGCTSDSSSATTVTVLPVPVFSVSANKTSICGGESATITATGCTGTILWTGGAMTTAITVSPTTNTTYTATCTVGSCSSSQQITITPLSTPSVTASGVLQCNGQPVTLTANNVPAGSSIQWRKDGIDIAGATGTTYSASVAGSYDFTSYSIESTTLSIGWANEIYTINGQVGFHISSNGISKTTDEGVSWTQVLQRSGIESITFTNSLTGFATCNDGNIAKTVDGGNTWSLSLLNSSSNLRRIKFKDSNNGVIVCNYSSNVYYTNNGGNTWTLASGTNISSSSTVSYRRIAFVPNSSTVYLLGYGTSNILLKSLDNGATWSQIPVDGFRNLFDISFTSNNNGWISCNGGAFLRTTDGANSWQVQSSGFSNDLYGVQFVDSQNGFTAGKLLKTSNGGTTWEAINTNAFTGAHTLSFVNKNIGWWTNNSTLIRYITPPCPTTPAVLVAPQKPNAPSITPPTNSTICQGSSITLSATGCAGTYTWTGGLTGSSVSVSPTATRSYKVACTVGVCVSDSSSATTVTVNLKPSQPIINQINPSICAGQSVNLTVTAINGATYAWTSGLTGTSISVYPSTNRTYKVASTINGCVSDSASVTVNVTSVSAPTISLGGEVCTNLLPVKLWDVTVPNADDDNVRSIIPTADGGNFMLFEGLYGSGTAIRKTDAQGNVQWGRVINIPSGYSEMKIAVATNDGGYLIGGKNNSTSIGGDVSSTCRLGLSNLPTLDFWILKVDANGVKQWDKRFGGNSEDDLNDLIKTSDGGYLLGGSTSSEQGGDISEQGNFTYREYWIIKIDANGIKQWDKRFNSGPFSYDCAINSLLQTIDGGYLLGGYGRPPYDPLNYSVPRTDDFFLVKVNSSGIKQWQALYDNNTGIEYLKSMQPTSDGGFLLVGNTNAMGGNIWTVKINSSGVKQWDKTFGGSGNDQANIIKPIPNENNFLIAGSSTSGINGDKTEASKGGQDMWILKIKQDGTKIWDKTLGGNRTDYANSLAVNNDGSIIVVGGSNSGAFGDKSVAAAQTYYDPFYASTFFRQDSWLVKIASNCPPQSSAQITLGDSLILKANPCAGTINWSNGMTGNSIKIKPTFNTTYTATCSTTCISPASTPFNVSVTGGICETVKSGAWNDPTVWACRIVPTANENVIINSGHTITDNGNTIRAKTLNYRGGFLQFSQTTNFILGN